MEKKRYLLNNLAGELRMPDFSFHTLTRGWVSSAIALTMACSGSVPDDTADPSPTGPDLTNLATVTPTPSLNLSTPTQTLTPTLFDNNACDDLLGAQSVTWTDELSEYHTSLQFWPEDVSVRDLEWLMAFASMQTADVMEDWGENSAWIYTLLDLYIRDIANYGFINPEGYYFNEIDLGVSGDCSGYVISFIDSPYKIFCSEEDEDDNGLVTMETSTYLRVKNNDQVMMNIVVWFDLTADEFSLATRDADLSELFFSELNLTIMVQNQFTIEDLQLGKPNNGCYTDYGQGGVGKINL